MAEYQSVLLVKSEVFVYKIPPRTTNRGYRANDWGLDNPDWTGRLRLITKGGTSCFIKLEDNSGALFAQCPVETYPGVTVESVSDSSRYFVLRIQDDNGRNAFIGVGFADRSDSFDFNVALQDHFKWVRKEEDILKEKDTDKPLLDLGFKEGQTIKINMKIIKKDGESSSSSRPKPKGGGIGILPPPPGGIKIAPPPSGSLSMPRSHQSQTSPQNSSAHLISISQQSSEPSSGTAPVNANSAQNANPNDDWIQF